MALHWACQDFASVLRGCVRSCRVCEVTVKLSAVLGHGLRVRGRSWDLCGPADTSEQRCVQGTWHKLALVALCVGDVPREAQRCPDTAQCHRLSQAACLDKAALSKLPALPEAHLAQSLPRARSDVSA